MSDAASEPNSADRDREETTVAPSEEQTSAVALAWSVADTAPDVETFADGRRPLSKTLLAFLTGVAVAAVALGAYVLGQHEPAQVSTAPTQPTSAAPSPTPSTALVSPPRAAPQPTSTTSVVPEPTSTTSVAPEPTSTTSVAPPAPTPPEIAAPPPPAPHPTSPDDAFASQLQAAGITFDSREVAVEAARRVCLELSVGNSVHNIATAVKADNPTLPKGRATDFVRLSVNAYCPQYN
jgi:hypothetical protein